jgi:uncharacterized membrane protein
MKKNIIKILALVIITLNLGSTVVIAAPTFTQSTIPKPATIPGPTGGAGNDALRKTLVTKVLPRLAVGMIGTVASLALVFLVIAGLRFATAYGNDEVIQKAKKQAIYAIVGLLVALMSYTIVTIVSNFNYTEFNPTTPPSTSTP